MCIHCNTIQYNTIQYIVFIGLASEIEASLFPRLTDDSGLQGVPTGNWFRFNFPLLFVLFLSVLGKIVL